MSQVYRVNEAITSLKVYLIDREGKPLGIVSRDQALYLAFDQGLDLIEVGPRADPPVAKIIDYGKFLYQQQKKHQKQKVWARVSEVKQIRLRATIDRHDLENKAGRGRYFLANGHKIKITIVLRGRHRALGQQAIGLVDQFLQLANGRYDTPPKLIGNLVHAVITRK